MSSPTQVSFAGDVELHALGGMVRMQHIVVRCMSVYVREKRGACFHRRDRGRPAAGRSGLVLRLVQKLA